MNGNVYKMILKIEEISIYVECNLNVTQCDFVKKIADNKKSKGLISWYFDLKILLLDKYG